MHRSLAGLLALLIATAFLPTEACRAQLSSDKSSYAQLLAKYDKNRNGLLDDPERATLLAPAEVRQTLPASAGPLICEGQAAGSAGGASASSEQRLYSPLQAARHVRWRRRQLAEVLPSDDPQLGQADPAEETLLVEESTNGYPSETSPQPLEPRRQNVRIRNVVQYRMLLNESRAQPRSQPFARAATFGPMLGRTKQRSPCYRSANVDVGCVSTRASIYGFARY